MNQIKIAETTEWVAISEFTESEKIIARCLFVLKNLLYIILYFVARVTSRHEVSILLYHSVDSNGAWHAVHPKEFIRQMEYLRKNYSIVSLNDIMDFAEKRNSLAKKSVAITFDDGYYDNYLNVYPYFRKHKLSATIFVTTGYCGKKALLDGIPLEMLGWNEIKEMSQNIINIGAHTITHPNLQKISLEETKNEILGSKEEIEKTIGRDVDYFAYPFGMYNDEIIDLVNFLGFKGAFGCGTGLIRKGDKPFVLNRVLVHSSVAFLMFKARLTKAFEWFVRIEQYAKKMINNFPILSKVYVIYHDTEYNG